MDCVLLVLVVVLQNVFSAEVFIQSRINNGEAIDIRKVPYQLMLSRNGRVMCGAALVKPDLALTAAHCIDKDGLYKVHGGSSFKNQSSITRKVIKMIYPSKFSRETADYDLGILFLDRAFKLGKYIKTIPVTEGIEPKIGDIVSVSGWGLIESAQKHTNELQHTEIPIIEDSYCNSSGERDLVITPRRFCAGNFEEQKSTCMGDSGGPATINGILYGIVSSGLSNCTSPVAFTNLAYFKNYLSKNAHLF